MHESIPETGERGCAHPKCEVRKSGQAAQALAPNGWFLNSPGRFRHGKEFFEAPQAFLDAFNGRGVR